MKLGTSLDFKLNRFCIVITIRFSDKKGNAPICLRLIRALEVETHEDCLEASPDLNMDLLKEPKKLRISLAA
jgi:hypothetical protein